MKFRSILFAAAAVLVTLAACKKEDKVPAGLTVDKPTVAFTAAGGTQVVKVTSSDPWTLTVPEAAKEWLTVQPTSGGKGTTEVTLSAGAREGKGRPAVKLNFIAGLFTASVSVSQEGTVPPGDGSNANPFSASEAYAWIMANLEDGKTTPTSQKYYVAGKIHKISVKDNVTYDFQHAVDKDGKNIYKATFFISDDGQSSKTDFEAYQVYYLGQRVWREGDDDIKVGDDVVIYGQLKHFKETAETGGSYDYLYSLNGETAGKAPAEDISKYETKTIKEFIDLAKTDTYYVISGLVSGFQLEGNPTQCTLTDETGSVTMYGVSDMSAFSGVKNDGTLTIAAKYKKYEKNGNVTHEAVDCIFGSFVEGTSAEPKGSGTLADPYNPAGAIAYIKSLSSTPSENEVYIKGKIASIKNEFDAEHGTAVFDISEDGTMKTTFTCYSVKFLENKLWVDGNTQIKKGDEVIVHSKVTVYNDVYETLSVKDGYKGYVYSLNGATTDTVKPVLTISEFVQTSTGIKAAWSYNMAAEGTEYTWTLSVKDGAKVDEGKTTTASLEKEVALTIGTEYELTVAVGETKDAATLTAKDQNNLKLTFPDDNSANNKISNYKCDWVAKKGDFSWNIVNFNNNSWGSNWSYIKTGWKTDALVSTITTAAPIATVVKSVTVAYDKFDASVATATTLYVASDKEFKNDVQKVVGSNVAAPEYTYTIPTPVANAYYKLEISCVKASANGGIQISAVTYNF